MALPQYLYKAHATGNDFVLYVDESGEFEPDADEVARVCDRHFGIGADGLIRLAHPSDVSDLADGMIRDCAQGGAEWFMDYRNADGSLAQMCGNGTRAVTLLALRKGLVSGRDGALFRLGTRAGVKTLKSLGAVPPYGDDVLEVSLGRWAVGPLEEYRVRLSGVAGPVPGTFVDMGNPHVVAVLGGSGSAEAVGGGGVAAALPDVESLDLSRKPVVSPVIESDQNVEFVRIDDCSSERHLGRATMRVYERGCGETLSCGTGLGASAVVLQAMTGIRQWDIQVRGGLLRVQVSPDTVRLTGAAELVGRVELL